MPSGATASKRNTPLIAAPIELCSQILYPASRRAADKALSPRAQIVAGCPVGQLTPLRDRWESSPSPCSCPARNSSEVLLSRRRARVESRSAAKFASEAPGEPLLSEHLLEKVPHEPRRHG